ncbi:MAG: hypothetical protein ABIG34_05390 [Candidatus Peregrinibacteria bacterium]
MFRTAFTELALGTFLTLVLTGILVEQNKGVLPVAPSYYGSLKAIVGPPSTSYPYDPCPGGCDDADPCTVDTCTDGAGCDHIPDPVCYDPCIFTGCDDGDPCTEDFCMMGGCDHYPIPNCCRDNSECTSTDPCWGVECMANQCFGMYLCYNWGACCYSDSSCYETEEWECGGSFYSGWSCDVCPMMSSSSSEPNHCEPPDCYDDNECTFDNCVSDEMGGEVCENPVDPSCSSDSSSSSPPDSSSSSSSDSSSSSECPYWECGPSEAGLGEFCGDIECCSAGVISPWNVPCSPGLFCDMSASGNPGPGWGWDSGGTCASSESSSSDSSSSDSSEPPPPSSSSDYSSSAQSSSEPLIACCFGSSCFINVSQGICTTFFGVAAPNNTCSPNLCGESSSSTTSQSSSSSSSSSGCAESEKRSCCYNIGILHYCDDDVCPDDCRKHGIEPYPVNGACKDAGFSQSKVMQFFARLLSINPATCPSPQRYECCKAEDTTQCILAKKQAECAPDTAKVVVASDCSPEKIKMCDEIGVCCIEEYDKTTNYSFTDCSEKPVGTKTRYTAETCTGDEMKFIAGETTCKPDDKPCQKFLRSACCPTEAEGSLAKCELITESECGDKKGDWVKGKNCQTVSCTSPESSSSASDPLISCCVNPSLGRNGIESKTESACTAAGGFEVTAEKPCSNLICPLGCFPGTEEKLKEDCPSEGYKIIPTDPPSSDYECCCSEVQECCRMVSTPTGGDPAYSRSFTCTNEGGTQCRMSDELGGVIYHPGAVIENDCSTKCTDEEQKSGCCCNVKSGTFAGSASFWLSYNSNYAPGDSPAEMCTEMAGEFKEISYDKCTDEFCEGEKTIACCPPEPKNDDPWTCIEVKKSEEKEKCDSSAKKFSGSMCPSDEDANCKTPEKDDISCCSLDPDPSSDPYADATYSCIDVKKAEEDAKCQKGSTFGSMKCASIDPPPQCYTPPKKLVACCGIEDATCWQLYLQEGKTCDTKNGLVIYAPTVFDPPSGCNAATCKIQAKAACCQRDSESDTTWACSTVAKGTCGSGPTRNELSGATCPANPQEACGPIEQPCCEPQGDGSFTCVTKLSCGDEKRLEGDACPTDAATIQNQCKPTKKVACCTRESESASWSCSATPEDECKGENTKNIGEGESCPSNWKEQCSDNKVACCQRDDDTDDTWECSVIDKDDCKPAPFRKALDSNTCPADLYDDDACGGIPLIPCCVLKGDTYECQLRSGSCGDDRRLEGYSCPANPATIQEKCGEPKKVACCSRDGSGSWSCKENVLKSECQAGDDMKPKNSCPADPADCGSKPKSCCSWNEFEDSPKCTEPSLLGICLEYETPMDVDVLQCLEDCKAPGKEKACCSANDDGESSCEAKPEEGSCSEGTTEMDMKECNEKGCAKKKVACCPKDGGTTCSTDQDPSDCAEGTISGNNSCDGVTCEKKTACCTAITVGPISTPICLPDLTPEQCNTEKRGLPMPNNYCPEDPLEIAKYCKLGGSIECCDANGQCTSGPGILSDCVEGTLDVTGVDDPICGDDKRAACKKVGGSCCKVEDGAASCRERPKEGCANDERGYDLEVAACEKECKTQVACCGGDWQNVTCTLRQAVKCKLGEVEDANITECPENQEVIENLCGVDIGCCLPPPASHYPWTCSVEGSKSGCERYGGTPVQYCPSSVEDIQKVCNGQQGSLLCCGGTDGKECLLNPKVPGSECESGTIEYSSNKNLKVCPTTKKKACAAEKVNCCEVDESFLRTGECASKVNADDCPFDRRVNKCSKAACPKVVACCVKDAAACVENIPATQASYYCQAGKISADNNCGNFVQRGTNLCAEGPWVCCTQPGSSLACLDLQNVGQVGECRDKGGVPIIGAKCDSSPHPCKPPPIPKKHACCEPKSVPWDTRPWLSCVEQGDDPYAFSPANLKAQTTTDDSGGDSCFADLPSCVLGCPVGPIDPGHPSGGSEGSAAGDTSSTGEGDSSASDGESSASEQSSITIGGGGSSGGTTSEAGSTGSDTSEPASSAGSATSSGGAESSEDASSSQPPKKGNCCVEGETYGICFADISKDSCEDSITGGSFLGNAQCKLPPATGANCGPTDEGSSSAGDESSSQESSEPGSCGNEILEIELNEQCDLGTSNSNAPNALCRKDCTPARCGDGIKDDSPTDGRNPERCDDGEKNSNTVTGACRTNCKYRNAYFTIGQWLQNLQLYAVDGKVVPNSPDIDENTQFIYIGALTFILM